MLMLTGFRLPSARLAHVVRYFWTLESPPGMEPGQSFKFITDGCPELLFHYGAVPIQNFGRFEGQYYQDAVALVGVSSKYAAIRLSGPTKAILAKLQPWAMGGLLGDSAHLLADRQLTPDLLPAKMRAGISRIVEAQDEHQAVQWIEEWLWSHFQDQRSDAQVAEAVRLLEQSHGCITLQSLEAKLNLSMRRLEQRFRSQVGISMKQFAKILRVRFAAEAMLHLPADGSLTDVAYDAGYFDQAHFIREFKSFVQMTPGQFAKQMRGKASVYQLEAGSPAIA